MAQPQLPSTCGRGSRACPRRSGRSGRWRHRVIQFKVTGAEPGNWVISVKDGAAPSPKARLPAQRHHQHSLGRVAEDPPRELDARRFHERPVHLHGDMGISCDGELFEQ